MSLFIVVEGPGRQFDQAVREVKTAGCRVDFGWPLAGAERASVIAADVRDRQDASQAVMAAITGYGLILHAQTDRPTLDSLCEDLRHVGSLQHRIGDEHPVLNDEEMELLELLSIGRSVSAVAGHLHLSRRSVERRLVRMRLLFDVPSQSALLLAYRNICLNVSHFPDAVRPAHALA